MICSGGGNGLPIGTPSDIEDMTSVSLQLGQHLLGVDLVDSDVAVCRGGCDSSAVGRECQAGNRVLMSLDDSLHLAVGNIPEGQRSISGRDPGAGCEDLAVWVKGEGKDAIRKRVLALLVPKGSAKFPL